MYDCSENNRGNCSHQTKYHKPHYREQQQFSRNTIVQYRKVFQANPSFENYNYDYWCETCDKGFRTLAHLEIHKQHHQKCNIDGCQFIAHPKIITKHIQMQHSTGLYKKIANLNDPEEIKKWREERKRKYPTKENIEKKVAEIKEKIDRGEKMGIRHGTGRRNLNKSGATYKDVGPHIKLQQPSKYPSKRFDSYTNRRNRVLNVDKPERHLETKKTCKQIVIQEETRKLKPFGGIQNLILDNDFEDESSHECEDFIEDDEYLKESPSIQESNNLSKPLLCGALTSLMCDYESSDEDVVSESTLKNDKLVTPSDDNARNSIKQSVTSHKDDNNVNCAILDIFERKECTEKVQNLAIIHENINPEVNCVSNQNEVDNDSGPEETKVIKAEPNNQVYDDLTNAKEHKVKMNKLKKDNLGTKNYRTFTRKIPSTLLEKLLHKEIQQERNIVLQCIRYIVKNNYFDKT